ncbi:MAG: PAS domain S-box protein, partial [Planctomycetota bacterium]|nr:PAS domain S-box protein [Planctomycetota bacterium]
MTRSADRSHVSARSTKAELLDEMKFLRSRVKKLERTHSDLERKYRALRESEGRLAALVEHMPAVAFVRDLDGRFKMVNRGYEETYAVSNDRVRGKTLDDVFPQETAEEYAAQDRQVNSENRVIEQEITVGPDGPSRVFSSIKFPILDTTGKMIAIGGIEQDITARKAAEATLRESEERFRAIIDQLPFSFSLKDDEDRYVMVNRKFHEWFIPKGTEVIGKSTHELFSDELARELKDIDRRVRETGETVVQETSQLFIDGTFHATRMTKFPIKLSGNRTMAVGTIDADITKLKKAEEEIERTREQLDAILESSPAGIAVTLRDSGKVVYANAGIAEQLGLGEDRNIGGVLTDHWVDAQERESVIGRAKEVGMIKDVEVLRRRSDGSEFWALMSALPITHEGQEALLTWTYDITDRKKVEQEVEAQRAQLNDILNNIQQAVVLWDKDQRLIAWNSHYPDTLRLEEGVLEPGMALYELVLLLAKRGHYGDGDPQELARKRVDYLWVEGLRADIAFGDERKFDIQNNFTTDGGLVITYSDITKRKHMEEALKDNERQLRKILEDSPIAVAISVDDQSEDDGIVEFANPRFIEMLGFDFEDIGTLRTEQFLPAGKQRDAFQKKLDEGASLRNMDIQISRRDGSKLWALMSMSPIRFNDRRSALFWHYDITDRKKAEAELGQIKERLDLALEGSGDGLWDWNVKTGDQYVDERWARMLGYELDEVEQNVRIYDRLIHPEDRPTMIAMVKRVLQSHAPIFAEEYRLRSKTGDWVWILSRAKVTERDENGDPVRLIGTHSDITARKKAEAALKESEAAARDNEEKLTTILDTTRDGVMTFEGAGVIDYWNPSCAQILGFTSEEVYGKIFVDFLVPEKYRPTSLKALRQFAETGEWDALGKTIETPSLHKSGREIMTEISFERFEKRGAWNAVGFLRDITERKQAEKALRSAKDQAENALANLERTQQQLVVTKKMAALGQLTAGIAHEIKNPLNFVNNFAETSVELLDDLKDVLEPVHKQFDKDTREEVDDIVETLKGDLQKINDHGKRADSIVKSMLQHARGDATERIATSVNELVEEAFNLSYHGERARDKSFQATLEQNLDDAAGQADVVPQEISRVLVNLFSNAFYAVKKRSQDEGTMDYTPTVAVWTENKGRNVEIRVRDNGIGMPLEVREKLFDPFFTTKPTGEGTGL